MSETGATGSGVVSYQRLGDLSPVAVTKGAAASLRLARPWMKFVAILLYIGMAMTFVGGAVFLLMALTGHEAQQPLWVSVLIAILYALFGLLYLPQASLLRRTSREFGEALRLNDSMALERALQAQHRFWRLVGVIIITLVVAYFLLIVGAMIYGVYSAATGMRGPIVRPSGM